MRVMDSSKDRNYYLFCKLNSIISFIILVSFCKFERRITHEACRIRILYALYSIYKQSTTSLNLVSIAENFTLRYMNRKRFEKNSVLRSTVSQVDGRPVHL